MSILDLVKKNPDIIKDLDETDQTEEICLEVVTRKEQLMRYVKKQSPKICMTAVIKDGMLLQFVNEQTPEICMAAIKQNVYAFNYVKKQTPEICLETVKRDGSLLRLVKNQTPEICMESVKQFGIAIKYVKIPTHDLCLEAVKQNGMAICYIKQKTPEICLAAVKQNGIAITYLNAIEQTSEVCKEAINQNGNAIEYIITPTIELYKLSFQKIKYVMIKYIDLNKYNVEDIIGETTKIYINVNELNKIVYRDLLSGRYIYIDRKDNMISSVIDHVKSLYDDNLTNDIKFIINENHQDVESLLITSDKESTGTSLHIVQTGMTYKLYKKSVELIETGYIISNKVFKPKILKLAEYFDPQI